MKKVNCKNCGESFSVKYKNDNRSFCSKDCYLIDHSKPTIHILTCSKCSCTYKRIAGDNKSRKNCDDCFRVKPPITQETKDKISRTKTVTSIVIRVCAGCHSEYSTKPYKKKKFCSYECMHNNRDKMDMSWTKESKERARQNQLGEKNSVWRGGVSFTRYRGDDGVKHKEWRAKVFERDNYTCQKCNARSGNGKKIHLQADHIKPYALCTEKQRWELNNGQTLCRECHWDKTRWENRTYWRNQYGSYKDHITTRNMACRAS